MWIIDFYEKPNGQIPVKEFLDNLPPKELVQVRRKLKLLAEFGNDLRRPHCAYLRDAIYELRAHEGRKQIRILYFFFDRGKIILANGIGRKEGQVPDQAIEQAVDFWNEYSTRNRREQR